MGCLTPHMLDDHGFSTSDLVEVRLLVQRCGIIEQCTTFTEVWENQGVVREYLTRNALNSTLKAFDLERVSLSVYVLPANVQFGARTPVCKRKQPLAENLLACSQGLHSQCPLALLCAKVLGWSGCISRSTNSRQQLPWSCGCCISSSSLQLQLMQSILVSSSLETRNRLRQHSAAGQNPFPCNCNQLQQEFSSYLPAPWPLCSL